MLIFGIQNHLLQHILYNEHHHHNLIYRKTILLHNSSLGVFAHCWCSNDSVYEVWSNSNICFLQFKSCCTYCFSKLSDKLLFCLIIMLLLWIHINIFPYLGDNQFEPDIVECTVCLCIRNILNFCRKIQDILYYNRYPMLYWKYLRFLPTQ